MDVQRWKCLVGTSWRDSPRVRQRKLHRDRDIARDLHCPQSSDGGRSDEADLLMRHAWRRRVTRLFVACERKGYDSPLLKLAETDRVRALESEFEVEPGAPARLVSTGTTQIECA